MEDRKSYVAGAGKAIIDFKEEDFPLKAYCGQHDPIHVRVILVCAEEEFAMVSIELTSLPEEAIKRFKAIVSELTNIIPDHIQISVTHTFSAPHIPPHLKTDEEIRLHKIMYDRILDALKKAINAALDDRKTTEIGYTKTDCCLNVNRNVETAEGWWTGKDEKGYSSKDLHVITLKHTDEIFAVLFNYDVQSSVMDQVLTSDGKLFVSADFVGAAACEVEEYYQGKATAIFLTGCAGDQAPIQKAKIQRPDGSVQDLHEEGYALVEKLGKDLGEKVIGAVQQTQSFQSTGLVKFQKRKVLLPKQKMQYTTKQLKPHKEYTYISTGEFAETEIVAFYIGEAMIMTTMPELNSSFGKRIREIVGDNVLVATLVNGGMKYLPEEEDFERITYTAMNTEIGRGSAQIFLQEVVKLKEEMKGE